MKKVEKEIKAWIARDSQGGLYLYYYNKPIRGNAIWYANNYCVKLRDDLYPQILWANEEPTKVEVTIKIKE